MLFGNLFQTLHIFKTTDNRILGKHLCVLKQEDRVLWWCHKMSSLRDVVAGRQSSLRSHHRGHQDCVQILYLHGLPVHTDVFWNVGLWYTWWLVFRKSGKRISGGSFREMEGKDKIKCLTKRDWETRSHRASYNCTQCLYYINCDNINYDNLFSIEKWQQSWGHHSIILKNIL